MAGRWRAKKGDQEQAIEAVGIADQKTGNSRRTPSRSLRYVEEGLSGAPETDRQRSPKSTNTDDIGNKYVNGSFASRPYSLAVIVFGVPVSLALHYSTRQRNAGS